MKTKLPSGLLIVLLLVLISQRSSGGPLDLTRRAAPTAKPKG